MIDQDTFSNSFATEAELQQAVAKLLKKMPPVKEVRILQGSQEYGKDLVFYHDGPLGDPMLYACVVKNTPITGSVASNQGARTVYIQAQQAFDTPHLDGNGKDVHVQHVFVVTPFDMQPSAITSIRGALQHRHGQITFFDRARLFDAFRKYWPDYLTSEGDPTNQYVKETEDALNRSHTLMDLIVKYNFGNFDQDWRNIYVQQSFERSLAKYEETLFLDKSLPTSISLRGEMRERDVRKQVNNLRKVFQLIWSLYEWGYGNQGDDSRLGKEVCSALEDLASSLDEEWKRSVRLKLNSDYINPDKEISLDDSQPLVKKLNKVIRIGLPHTNAPASGLLAQSLVELRRRLERHAQIVDELPDSGTSLLSSERFLEACAFDNYAKSSSNDLLRPVRQRVKVVRFPKDILDQWVGSVLIVGAAGYGKTLYCSRNALRDLERWNSADSDILPVYIPLQRLAKSSLRSFEDVFLSSVGKSALLVKDGNRDPAKADRIRLYLDGLDEVPKATQRRDIVNLVRSGIEGDSKYQVVMTARDYIFDPSLNWMPRIHLSGFDASDIRHLVESWLGENSNATRAFFDQLGKLPAIKELMRTPLLATLIILVFRQTNELPRNRVDLYGRCVDLLSGGWDIAKNVLRETKYDNRVKRALLLALAYNTQARKSRQFRNHEFIGIAKVTVSSTAVADWETLRDEVLQDGIITRNGAVMQFCHLSFQEYLAAYFMAKEPEPTRIQAALEAFLQGDEWVEGSLALLH